MGILDEAIKEHLELKRQHGANEPELQQLEDEAFGAAERPGADGPASDALAEAPTEFMAQPESAEAYAEEAPARRPPALQVADLQEAPHPGPKAPAEEEAPAMEHEAVLEPEAGMEPEPPAGRSTEERQAIAEQPTEMYNVEEELAGSEPQAPSEEELVEEELSEPRLAPVDPLAGLDEADDDALEVSQGDTDDADLDEEFWDEKRLSDELDQALEAPRETEAEIEVVEPLAEEEDESAAEDEDEGEESHTDRDEDVLEETPDFLEEAPEDDQLWFEQKPPKDFDFDD